MRLWIMGCAAALLLWPAPAGAEAPAADKMAHQIASTLRESGELSNYRVGVKYDSGVAWLEGSVTSEEQSAAAARLVGGVDGVEHVVNKLAIKPAEEPSQPSEPAPVQAAAEKPALEKTAASTGQDDVMQTLMQQAPQALPAVKPVARTQRTAMAPNRGMPRPIQRVSLNQQQPIRQANYGRGMATPTGYHGGGAAGANYDSANMPGYAWPSYAAHPNYSALTYPKQYSPSAWPYIGPFYPYPQVPLGWRKVTLEWDDGWWFLDFSHHKSH